MFVLSALKALGYIKAARIGVDVVWLDLSNGKTLRMSWAEFGRTYRY